MLLISMKAEKICDNNTCFYTCVHKQCLQQKIINKQKYDFFSYNDPIYFNLNGLISNKE